MTFPVVVLLTVFAGIAVRQVGGVRLQIWQLMLFGAATVLLSGDIAPRDALRAIDTDIMIFLFGMFLLGRALVASGWLAHVAYGLFSRARSADSLLYMIVFGAGLLYMIVFGAGLLSALLMNDTVAIIGTPLVLLLARQHAMHTQPLLLALAFSVTIGSVMSPVGNPQNLLIAMGGGIDKPFISFGWYLLLPTLLNLFITVVWLKWRYHGHFGTVDLDHRQEPLQDRHLALLARTGLLVVVIMIVAKAGFAVTVPAFDFPLTWIAVAAMLPVVLFSSRRIEMAREIDWKTLLFFASMFVLMRSVWLSGFFQALLKESGADITSLSSIMAISIILSQLVSNVPFVALYLPFLDEIGATTISYAVLAAASTIAGNVLILGAASNVIIVQQAENQNRESVSFIEFAIAGIPLTLINALVYWAYFLLVGD